MNCLVLYKKKQCECRIFSKKITRRKVFSIQKYVVRCITAIICKIIFLIWFFYTSLLSFFRKKFNSFLWLGFLIYINYSQVTTKVHNAQSSHGWSISLASKINIFLDIVLLKSMYMAVERSSQLQGHSQPYTLVTQKKIRTLIRPSDIQTPTTHELHSHSYVWDI